MRLCKAGDTICTSRPYDGSDYLHTILETPEAVGYANYLIRAGRWRVVRCGECGHVVEECQCVGEEGDR